MRSAGFENLGSSDLITSVSYFDIRLNLIEENISIVDLRAPIEFVKGSIPESHSLPLFDDGERSEIGTIYKNEGSTEAVALGLELFSRKAADFLERLLRYSEFSADGKTICLYCWRGGMRSHSVAIWLSLMGVKVLWLRGGYKAYRNQVLTILNERFATHPLLVLNGRTGVGKSDLLRELPEDFPIIDFEGLACHRGSALGDFNYNATPPTQQNFENRLANEYLLVTNYKEILVEIEDFIGPVRLPHKLRNNVFSSPMVFLERDMEDRINRIAKEYTSNWGETQDLLFEERMKLFRKHLSSSLINAIVESVKCKDFYKAIRLLLENRYDRLYDRNLTRHRSQAVASFNLSIRKDQAVEYLMQRCYSKTN